MMHTQSNDARYREAIERELRDRLAQDQTPPVSAPPRRLAPSQNPLAGVALVCLACRGTSEADARFCTSCGKAFNAMVVAARGRTEAR